MAEIPLTELVRYLDDYLRVAVVPDYADAQNGLQLEGKPVVRRVAAAVDACRSTIEQAVASGADMLIVHHGLFWGGVQRMVGPAYRRLCPAFNHGLSIYSSHLPLDAHPEVGNNYQWARLLGLNVVGPFGTFHDQKIGVECSTDLARGELMERLDAALGGPSKLLPCGPLRVRRVGLVTGGGGSVVEEAATTGIDTVLTGEAAHHVFLAAEEREINVFLCGHYATETLGIRALAAHLGSKFGLDWEFISHPSGL